MDDETTHLYPLKFAPILKQKLWGGNKINKIYRHDNPALSSVGESWDVSALDEDNDSEVINGFLKDNTLGDLTEVYMGDLVGDSVYERYGNRFPLLLKLIDSNDKLSVQVHPDDSLAADVHEGFGKTEMWYIMDADPDAYVILGFTRQVSKEEYVDRVANNTLEEVLKKYPVKKGDVLYIPAGCVHSIGKGCLILEVQQASDITYRIYDYNRIDKDGNPRELHTDLALRAVDFDKCEGKKIDVKPEHDQLVSLIESPYFNVNLMTICCAKEYELAIIDSFVILSCVEGHVTCKWDDDYLTLVEGESILIPAEMTSMYLVPTVESKLLETYVKI